MRVEFVSILSHALGQRWGIGDYAYLWRSSGGVIYGHAESDGGLDGPYDYPLGTFEEVIRELIEVSQAAGLSPRERAFLLEAIPRPPCSGSDEDRAIERLLICAQQQAEIAEHDEAAIEEFAKYRAAMARARVLLTKNPVVTVRLPCSLRQLTQGQDDFHVRANTVGEALGAVVLLFPDVGKRLWLDTGELNPYLWVSLNESRIEYCGGLQAPTKAGDFVSIIPRIAM